MSELESINHESTIVRQNELEVVVVIRSGITEVNRNSLKDFGVRLKQAVEASRPTIVAIEYKEGVGLDQDYSISDYTLILQKAVEVLRPMGVKVTNGGLEGDIALLLALADLKNQEPDKVEEVLLSLPILKQKFLTGDDYSERITEFIDIGNELINIYKHSKLDYLNLHWEESSDLAFEITSKYLKRKSEMKLVSTEFVLPNNPEVSKKIMKASHAAKFHCIIWYFGLEGHDGTWLVDQKGRPTEYADHLQRFVWWRYNKNPRVKVGREKEEQIRDKSRINNRNQYDEQ